MNSNFETIFKVIRNEKAIKEGLLKDIEEESNIIEGPVFVAMPLVIHPILNPQMYLIQA